MSDNPRTVKDAVITAIDAVSASILKVFSGRFVLAVAAAYGIVFIIEHGRETDPIIASLITLIVKSYFDVVRKPGE